MRHDVAFPWSGALLLVALLVLAAWAWWKGARDAPWRLWTRRAVTDPDERIDIVASVVLDAATRLHCVHWHGQTLLIATQAAAAPVVLARDDGPRQAP